MWLLKKMMKKGYCFFYFSIVCFIFFFQTVFG